MNGKQFVSKLDYILQWISRLVILNVLWIFFSILGLFVAGIFPATAALLGVARKWIMGEHEIKIWNTFKQIYRQEFATANIIGWILSIAGIILFINYQLISNSTGELFFVIPFAFYFIVFFYTILLIWAFPLLVHYKATWRQHIKNAIIIGLSKIHYTIMCGLVMVSIIYFSLSYPGLIPFFTFSAIGCGSMWFSLQIFKKMDQGLNSQLVDNR
ncbi:YesL family protein [Metabacillus sp. FJAT-53654]|uniref:YesL family protein n=1 Tax=Metabacillus rhizosphaerae TaxID=3117747 RepID=A0ABZ2MSS6_9BACI